MNQKWMMAGVLLGAIGIVGGCDWMDDYPNNPHTESGDMVKSGPGSYGGANASSVTGNGGINQLPQSDRPSELPGTGTGAGAGSGSTDNSPGNVTGTSSHTEGTGAAGTSTYGGSSAAGSDAGQTNNNGTSGPVPPTAR